MSGNGSKDGSGKLMTNAKLKTFHVPITPPRLPNDARNESSGK
jgi:hypothetical protein